GSVGSLRPILRIFISRSAAADRSLSGPRANNGVLAPMERSLSQRRALGGSGKTLVHHLEGFDLRADRRDRCCCDHLAARARGRREELGLSLLLAARRPLPADGPYASRIL